MSFGARYLLDPDLFPGRQSGERWGAEGIAVELIGGPYRFLGLNAAQLQVVRARYGVLCAPPAASAEPGVTLQFFRIAADELRPQDLRGQEYTFDLDYEPHAVRLAGPGFMARLDWQPSLHCALWTPAAGGGDFEGICANVFRVLVAYRLLEQGGALLHSAGVVDGGRAHLFLGRSGAGKTTLSRLSLEQGRQVLSDDMNALRGGDDGLWVERMPFAGDLGQRAERASALPLASLYRLRQGAGCRLTELGKAAATALLVACAPFVNDDPHRVDQLVANTEALAATVSCHELTFALDSDVWQTIRAALTPRPAPLR